MIRKILLLAGNTLRAKAYCQILSERDDIEVYGLLYGFEDHSESEIHLNPETAKFFIDENIFTPNLNIPIKETFIKNNWTFVEVKNRDANSEEVLTKLASLESDLVVFAGYGGQLLSQAHFKTDSTPYLHMHPGILPAERGSTTIYYSILNRQKCGVTAFYMNAQIDAGQIVLKKDYPEPSKGVNVDLWYDNCIRADCLNRAIDVLNNQSEHYETESTDDSEEYYVIHPILKHIALLSLK